MTLPQKNTIKLEKVRLGKTSLEIPVASFHNDLSSKTILVTAGMDGDEYTGIEAAYHLINQFGTEKPPCNITILPIMNIPGFENFMSYNPKDGKYPKHIYPGNAHGSETEQLIHWLSSNYLKSTVAWIDLHSGNLTEDLTPFIWSAQTKSKDVNQIVLSAFSRISPMLSIYETHSDKKSESLARQDTAYFLLESGEKGKRELEDIARHVKWVNSICEAIVQPSGHFPAVSTYTTIHEYIAVKDGLYTQHVKVGESVKKKQLIGEISSLTHKSLQMVSAGDAGVILWQKSGLFCKKGETVIAVASDKKSIFCR